MSSFRCIFTQLVTDLVMKKLIIQFFATLGFLSSTHAFGSGDYISLNPLAALLHGSGASHSEYGGIILKKGDESRFVLGFTLPPNVWGRVWIEVNWHTSDTHCEADLTHYFLHAYRRTMPRMRGILGNSQKIPPPHS